MTETLAPYEFDYAMSRLKDAIDYAFQTGEFEGVRLWAVNVEESHKAEVKDMQETISSVDEGLRLFHSIASNGEQSVLSRLDNDADVMDINRWMDELTQPASKTINLNGYKATATASWRERHLNEVHNDYNKFLEEKANE